MEKLQKGKLIKLARVLANLLLLLSYSVKLNIMKPLTFLVHAGYFGVSIIHQTLTWTTKSLSNVSM